MIAFSAQELFPPLLRSDKNGNAICEAICRALQICCDAAQQGYALIYDVDSMPEWRLDEMAWETACLYDYAGTLAQKRYWIKNAIALYRTYGTKQAVQNFLRGFFETVTVEESSQYGGEPFHFRLTLGGQVYSANNLAWAKKTIEHVKSLRSVLDDTVIDGGTADILISAYTHCFYPSIPCTAEKQLIGAMDY